jgi:hypothetical protein
MATWATTSSKVSALAASTAAAISGDSSPQRPRRAASAASRMALASPFRFSFDPTLGPTACDRFIHQLMIERRLIENLG